MFALWKGGLASLRAARYSVLQMGIPTESSQPSSPGSNLAALEQLGGLLPPSLHRALPAILAHAPEPELSLSYLDRFLRDAPNSVVSLMERQPAALHHLILVFSHSRFLSESLLQQPELLRWLHQGTSSQTLARLKSQEDLLEDFARFAATASEQPHGIVLTRFKRREYLRIMLRDVLGLATLTDTTLELSQLADVLLDRALRYCEQHLENLFGAPQFTDTAGRVHPARMVLLSLGKLGGQELNYSSDVDLMFLYSHSGETAGGKNGQIPNSEYFVRMAQSLLKLITELTPQGQLFRVDMRLRPEGQLGDLAIALPAALDYYRTRAREWELQMLIKGRVSAGDAESGREFLRQIHPLIFRRELHITAVEAVLKAREQITKGLERGSARAGDHSAAWNVKLTPGGIRDIEFIAQGLQRVHGAAEPWLAAAGTGATLVALQRLHDKGFLTAQDLARLMAAYGFLRKVEHRLQLLDGLQDHTLPDSAAALDSLAQRCEIEAQSGRDPGELLQQRIAGHFYEVRAIYARLITASSSPSDVPASEDQHEHHTAGLAPLLRRIHASYPRIAQILDGESAQPDRPALPALSRFLSSAFLILDLLGEIEQHPDWLARAAQLFSQSDLAAEMLSRRPDDIRLLDATASPAENSIGLPDIPGGSPLEERLAALRVAWRLSTFRLLVNSLEGRSLPFDTFAAISALAEATMRRALLLAFEEFPECRGPLADRPPTSAELEASPFAVIALGRLGSGEMDFGSDVDLAFLVDEAASTTSVGRWRSLAERFVQVLSSHTREGILFPVDTRLRPHGREGELVQVSSYWRDYFRKDASAWEAASYLKARGVAGNPALARWAIENALSAFIRRHAAAGEHPGKELRAVDPQESLAAELVRTRARLEQESSAIGAKSVFSSSAGGFYDVDYTVAFLELSRPAASESRPRPPSILARIGALESGGALTHAQATTLGTAARLFRSIDHAIRISFGNAPPEPREAAQRPRVSMLLRLWNVPGWENPPAALDSARQSVRNFFGHFLQGESR
jgi:glutamate-ammonia-ligase adenylyltransferase